MTEPWQQPVRPMVYQLLGTEVKARWAPVLFIRPTSRGWEIMGEPGCVWGPNDVTLRLVGQ